VNGVKTTVDIFLSGPPLGWRGDRFVNGVKTSWVVYPSYFSKKVGEVTGL